MGPILGMFRTKSHRLTEVTILPIADMDAGDFNFSYYSILQLYREIAPLHRRARTEPKEQKTQQSPAFGRTITSHPSHA